MAEHRIRGEDPEPVERHSTPVRTQNPWLVGIPDDFERNADDKLRDVRERDVGNVHVEWIVVKGTMRDDYY